MVAGAGRAAGRPPAAAAAAAAGQRQEPAVGGGGGAGVPVFPPGARVGRRTTTKIKPAAVDRAASCPGP
jgi:hypothetical protein